VTSRQDLLEAQAYVRRRLHAVLVGGAPGGAEPEPFRAARALVGGLLVSVALLAGSAVLALLR
jgi:hypothetical protein